MDLPPMWPNSGEDETTNLVIARKALLWQSQKNWQIAVRCFFPALHCLYVSSHYA